MIKDLEILLDYLGGPKSSDQRPPKREQREDTHERPREDTAEWSPAQGRPEPLGAARGGRFPPLETREGVPPPAPTLASAFWPPGLRERTFLSLQARACDHRYGGPGGLTQEIRDASRWYWLREIRDKYSLEQSRSSLVPKEEGHPPLSPLQTCAQQQQHRLWRPADSCSMACSWRPRTSWRPVP